MTAVVREDVERADIREWFKDHRATFNAHVAEPLGVQTLHWAKPDSGHCAIRYVIQGPTLMVWGDLESAIYRWSSAISWEFLADCNLQYFKGKCEASPKGRDYRDYDADIGLQDFNDDVRRSAEEGYKTADPELLDEGRRALADGGWEWQGWMYENANDAFGADWCEWVPDFGKRISMTCHAHLIGIKMAVAQRGAKS